MGVSMSGINLQQPSLLTGKSMVNQTYRIFITVNKQWNALKSLIMQY